MKDLKMNYKILSCESASEYLPENDKTYLIRIFDTGHLKLDKYPNFSVYPPLKHEEKFYKIINLYFDDVDPFQWENKEDYEKMLQEDDEEEFNENIAKYLLEELKDYDYSYDLIVHCRAGVSRSSAVFIYLNELFKLGLSKSNLQKEYPYFNKYIYHILKKVK